MVNCMSYFQTRYARSMQRGGAPTGHIYPPGPCVTPSAAAAARNSQAHSADTRGVKFTKTRHFEKQKFNDYYFFLLQGCKLNPKEFSVCNVYLDKDASDVKVFLGKIIDSCYDFNAKVEWENKANCPDKTYTIAKEKCQVSLDDTDQVYSDLYVFRPGDRVL